MIRILTILLLPLLFIATSCDSGGEGTACAINPTGIWSFTQFDLDFSEECDCGDTTCDELLGGSILDEVSCVSVAIVGGNVSWDSCSCDRDIGDCVEYTSYTCSDTNITTNGDTWTVTGDVATMTVEESIEDFMNEFGIDGDPDAFGIGCMITSTVSLTRE